MIPSKFLTQIAKSSGVERKLVERLLTSQPVQLRANNLDDSPGTIVDSKAKYLNLGLRIASAEIFLALVGKLSEEAACALISEAIKEYTQICPQIVGWIGRGDYDPKRVPAELRLATLKHASRTAGRLRARILRSC